MPVMGIEALVPRPAPKQEPRRAQRYHPDPAARPEDCRAEPRVGGRRDLHPDGVRLPLLVAIIDSASRAVLAWRLSDANDAQLLRGGAGGGAASVRRAADLNTDRSRITASSRVGMNSNTDRPMRLVAVSPRCRGRRTRTPIDELCPPLDLSDPPRTPCG